MIKKLLRKFFPWIADLERKNEELKAEVDKRQDAINKTNAYWKKRFYERERRR
jgi:hypothetical protein